jgi:(2Fe-2S) ferredoxin
MTKPMAGFRCSTASRALEEPTEGTASTVRAFLLLETSGPWGVDAVRDSRLPAEVKRLLRGVEHHNRVRPLLIRRPGRAVAGAVRVFAAYVHSDRPWLETALLSNLDELTDVDVSRLGEGHSPGLEPVPGPLFGVCTHGRHDACCAERGRPLCAALSAAAPEQTWEISHIGGDRFAANVLVLPHGLYYGRLGPEDAAEFASTHLSGRLDVEHLRGRSSYPFSVQAAEIYLRRHLGDTRIEPFELAEHTRRGTDTTAVFRVDGGAWEVRVHADLGDARQLTCRAAALSLGPAHRLVSITSREGPAQPTPAAARPGPR